MLVWGTDGAMITLAPGMGSCFPSIEEGTWDSQESSSEVKVDARDEYHEPAWLAKRVVILMLVLKTSCKAQCVRRVHIYRAGCQFRL